MQSCFQHLTQNMLEHGVAVHDAFLGILSTLAMEHVQPAPQQCLPDWMIDNRVDLLSRLASLDVMRAYHWYHDCGKPACRTVDAEGRQHFPNHAAVSEQVWLGAGGDSQVARLIGMDMLLHTGSAEDMVVLAKLPESASLLLTAFAEIHANAALFGGIESTSFKIKYKHLDRRGKAILRAWESIGI